METRYNSKTVEEKWYKFWEENKFFHAVPDNSKKAYSIVIPPPNITGILHMGHALNNTIQDILIRSKRMQGYCALWIPGTDHAGIATQNVVERQVASLGMTRDDLGREKFIERVWEWKEEYGSTIVRQLRKLGASCDWERERFTMDEGLSDAVLEAFISLFNKGLIYRGNYIINWCPRCKTALSEEEVDYKEQEGYLYYLKYPVINSEGKFVTVATTRPETMLGDVAVAVHPSDERYEFLKEKKILLPLLNRELLLVKDEAIDPDFGTGAVKITPAHDVTDFEIGLRHNLKPIVIMDENGVMNKNAAAYCGMDRFKARKKIAEDLEAQDLIEKIEPYVHSIGHCYRCHTIIEPYISWQWFVKMKPLASPAIKSVIDKKIEFFPKRWEKVYLHWMQNIKDWCISRQIWWGHRIPVYYCKNCWRPKDAANFEIQDARKLKGLIISKTTPESCPHCKGVDIVQDKDVLDTWFSSWLWPFSTMGWPCEKSKIKNEKSKMTDLEYFYPTSALVTAQEILFFWVARMIIAGFEFLGDAPFSDVYIHGTVRDDKGRKMSKSLGNIIDPLEIIDEYGADALRFSLISITAIGQDVFLSKDKFIFGRNFTNKIWNAARFIVMNVKDFDRDIKIKNLSLFDKWILSSLSSLVAKVDGSIAEYNFNEAAGLIYEFFWHKFCDWYIEIKKRDLYSETESISKEALVILIFVLDNLLKILHPFMPFITEEIWQILKPNLKKVYQAMSLEYRDSETIMYAPWPRISDKFKDKEAVSIMNKVIDIIQCIRNIRAELNVPAAGKVEVILSGANSKVLNVFKKDNLYLLPLANISNIETFKGDIEKPKHSAFGIVGGINIYVLLQNVIDIEAEKVRLIKKKDEMVKELDFVRKKLKNKDFINKANSGVVAKVKNKEKELKDQTEGIISIIDNL